MITYNADGSIQTIIQGDSGIIRRDPWFIGPLPSTSNPAGTDFNKPSPDVATWFAESLQENLNDLGTTIYDLGVAGYNKVATNVSRLAESSANVARSAQSGAASAWEQYNPFAVVSKAASGIGDFFQSTLWKILLILLIAAVTTIFLMTYIQTKAGRIGNA